MKKMYIEIFRFIEKKESTEQDMGVLKDQNQILRKKRKGNLSEGVQYPLSSIDLLCPRGLLLLFGVLLVQSELVLVDDFELGTEVHFRRLLLLQLVEFSLGL